MAQHQENDAEWLKRIKRIRLYTSAILFIVLTLLAFLIYSMYFN